MTTKKRSSIASKSKVKHNNYSLHSKFTTFSNKSLRTKPWSNNSPKLLTRTTNSKVTASSRLSKWRLSCVSWTPESKKLKPWAKTCDKSLWSCRRMRTSLKRQRSHARLCSSSSDSSWWVYSQTKIPSWLRNNSPSNFWKSLKNIWNN